MSENDPEATSGGRKLPRLVMLVPTVAKFDCFRPLRSSGVHWDNAHQNNVHDRSIYPKLSAGINHPLSGRAKASSTMIEVVTVSLVFFSAIIFAAHAFAAFRMR
jgi:hypothetical protein